MINGNDETVGPIGRALGVTRLARITSLDRCGIEVFSAIRPSGHVLQVSQGKGLDVRDAIASALGEAAELAAAERVQSERLEFFDGRKPGDLSFTLLKSVRQFARGYESEACPLWLWEEAILQGNAAFRFLRERRRARLMLDLQSHSLAVGELPDLGLAVAERSEEERAMTDALVARDRHAPDERSTGEGMNDEGGHGPELTWSWASWPSDPRQAMAKRKAADRSTAGRPGGRCGATGRRSRASPGRRSARP